MLFIYMCTWACRCVTLNVQSKTRWVLYKRTILLLQCVRCIMLYSIILYYVTYTLCNKLMHCITFLWQLYKFFCNGRGQSKFFNLCPILLTYCSKSNMFNSMCLTGQKRMLIPTELITPSLCCLSYLPYTRLKTIVAFRVSSHLRIVKVLPKSNMSQNLFLQ
jgi:hypothetical protein